MFQVSASVIPMDLQQLSDRLEIIDVLTRYTVAVDRKDYADLQHVFTPDAVLDYSSPGGPIGPPAEVVPWIEKGLAGFARTMHQLGQIQVTLDGDSATATAYFFNPMVIVRPDGSEHLIECGGYYHLTLVRTDDGWRSSGIRDELVWSRGF